MSSIPSSIQTLHPYTVAVTGQTKDGSLVYHLDVPAAVATVSVLDLRDAKGRRRRVKHKVTGTGNDSPS